MTSAERPPIAAAGWRPGPRRWLLLATAVLLLAAAFRLVALDEVPPGLAQDEVLDADIALFIRGGEHALFFRHGYGHEPLYHYWAALFQGFYGDNILSIRLPAVYLGLLLVALALRWAKRDYGPTAALVAGLGLAVSWWPVLFSRIGIRPILEPVLLVAAMWFWPLRAKNVAGRVLRSAALAGLFLGLSIYSYTAARVILLIPLILLVALAGQFLGTRRSIVRAGELAALRAQMILALIVLLVGSAVYLPLMLTLRAHPELQQRLEQLEGPLAALESGDAGPVLRMTAATLGVFSFTGDPRWTYSLPDRPLFDPLTAALFYGGLILALWKWRRPIYLVLPIWLAVTLLPSNLSPDAPSTVRLIGALPVVYLLPGLAVTAIGRRLRRRYPAASSAARRVLALFVLGLLAILAVNSYRTIRDGFIRWPRELETRLRYQTTLRDIGRHWLATGPLAPPVVAEVFYEPIDGDSLRRSIGADPLARWIQTGAGVAGALVWPGGEASASRLYVPEYAPLDPALAALAEIDETPLFRGDGSPSFAVYPLPLLPPAGQSASVDFGREDNAPVTLIDVIAPISDGGQLSLATRWRVNGPLPADAAIFVHLISEAGEIVAQYDGLDVAPTTLQPGDVFLQRHVLPLPESLEPGAYRLLLGMYDRGTGARLPTANRADSLEIAHCDRSSSDQAALDCRLTDP